MWSRARFPFLVAVLAAAALAGGCGFTLAGTVGRLPPVMRTVYLNSSQPYGGLENDLRRAIIANGGGVANERSSATAVLDILEESQQRRVLAVNSRGRPQEYALTYTVRYELLDAHGKQLLAPAKIQLRRDLAYSVNIELGAGRRQKELLGDMQQEATRLMMLRLQALGTHPARPAPAATTKSNV